MGGWEKFEFISGKLSKKICFLAQFISTAGRNPLSKTRLTEKLMVMDAFHDFLLPGEFLLVPRRNDSFFPGWLTDTLGAIEKRIGYSICLFNPGL